MKADVIWLFNDEQDMAFTSLPSYTRILSEHGVLSRFSDPCKFCICFVFACISYIHTASALILFSREDNLSHGRGSLYCYWHHSNLPTKLIDRVIGAPYKCYEIHIRIAAVDQICIIGLKIYLLRMTSTLLKKIDEMF